ncbi:MAG: hypothetical protein M1818_004936 [Claussenomyces sp. TS43310]|nr:MAG: hypothetical protein M1818_004936 [Claussenomyces sp. TS43310]
MAIVLMRRTKTSSWLPTAVRLSNGDDPEDQQVNRRAAMRGLIVDGSVNRPSNGGALDLDNADGGSPWREGREQAAK